MATLKKKSLKHFFLLLAGWTGATMLLAGYYLIQTNKVTQRDTSFIILNAVGAGLLMINSWYHKAYPSAVTNLIWFIVGSYFIAKLFV